MTSWLEGHPGLPRLLAGLDPSGGPMTLAEHARVHGELPHRSPLELIESIERSGLRGRGGADFPTARKLRAVAARRRVSAVIVNGSETEPASAKDRLLLSRLPHLVLDGAVLAAGAVGAREVIVKLGDERGRLAAGARGSGLGRAPTRCAIEFVDRAGGIRRRRGERRRPLPQRRPRAADVRAAAPVRARLPRSPDADPEPRDARADRARRALRRALVSRARHERRSRLGAGHDLRRGRGARASTSSRSGPR